jgi:hypothetical protein
MIMMKSDIKFEKQDASGTGMAAAKACYGCVTGQGE